MSQEASKLADQFDPDAPYFAFFNLLNWKTEEKHQPCQNYGRTVLFQNNLQQPIFGFNIDHQDELDTQSSLSEETIEEKDEPMEMEAFDQGYNFMSTTSFDKGPSTTQTNEELLEGCNLTLEDIW